MLFFQTPFSALSTIATAGSIQLGKPVAVLRNPHLLQKQKAAGSAMNLPNAVCRSE